MLLAGVSLPSVWHFRSTCCLWGPGHREGRRQVSVLAGDIICSAQRGTAVRDEGPCVSEATPGSSPAPRERGLEQTWAPAQATVTFQKCKPHHITSCLKPTKSSHWTWGRTSPFLHVAPGPTRSGPAAPPASLHLLFTSLLSVPGLFPVVSPASGTLQSPGPGPSKAAPSSCLRRS